MRDFSNQSQSKSFLRKSYLDHREIDAKLCEFYKSNSDLSKSLKMKGASHQSALSLILSFVGGVLVAIWLFFLLTFGFSAAKAQEVSRCSLHLNTDHQCHLINSK